MKFTQLALTLFFSIILFSCSNDDDSSSNPITIVKEWHVTDISVVGTGETSSFGQPITVDVLGEETDISYEITFTEDPNNVMDTGGYGMIFNASSGSGASFTETYSSMDLFDGGTWTYEANEITINSNGNSTVYTVTNLTSNSFSMTGNINRDVVVQGQTISMNIDVTYSMEY